MEVCTGDICDWKGVTRQTVQNWLKDGLPVKSEGKAGVATIFESKDVDRWLTEREISKRVVKSDGEDYDRQKEEARLKHHQANNEALKEAEKCGQVLDTSLVVELCSAGVTNCRNRLLAVDKKLRNEFPGLDDEVFERIYLLHEDALLQLGEAGLPNGLRDRMAQYLGECEAST